MGRHRISIVQICEGRRARATALVPPCSSAAVFQQPALHWDNSERAPWANKGGAGTPRRLPPGRAGSISLGQLHQPNRSVIRARDTGEARAGFIVPHTRHGNNGGVAWRQGVALDDVHSAAMQRCHDVGTLCVVRAPVAEVAVRLGGPRGELSDYPCAGALGLRGRLAGRLSFVLSCCVPPGKLATIACHLS